MHDMSHRSGRPRTPPSPTWPSLHSPAIKTGALPPTTAWRNYQLRIEEGDTAAQYAGMNAFYNINR
ncbi:MAG: hypothetical protein ACLTMP_05300 [Eggerthella lenta]